MATAKLSLNSTIDKSEMTTAFKWGVVNRKVIMQLTSLPARVSGDGEFRIAMAVDLGNGNRAVIRRKTVVNVGGTVTAANDVLQCSMVVNGSDPKADAVGSDFQWNQLPVVNPTWFALGLYDDGQTVSFQVSTDGITYKEVVRRFFSGTDFTNAAAVTVAVYRDAAATVIPGVMTVARVQATTSPVPSPGGTLAKSDTALHFDGAHARVFPLLGNAAALLIVKKQAASPARRMIPVSLSQEAGGPIDNFNRANGAIGASYVAAHTGGIDPTIVGNRVRSAAALSRMWRTGGVAGGDASVMFTLAHKPANPATTQFSWLVLLAKGAGSGNTSTGYMLGIGLTNTGTSSWIYSRLNAGSASSLTGINLLGSGTGLPGATILEGDQIGFRVVGTTLRSFFRRPPGEWSQVGADYTDTVYNFTGTLAGFGVQYATSLAPEYSEIDDWGAWPATAIGDTFPLDRGGKYMRIETTRQPQWYDNVVSPSAQVGAGLEPTYPSWVMTLVERDPTSGQVSTRIWNAASGAFSDNPNVGSLPAGATIADSGARFVIGDRETIQSTERSFVGDIAAVAAFSTAPPQDAFQGLVQPGGAVSINALATMDGVVRAYDLTTLANPGDQIMDLVAANHEVTAEAVGTGTITTDTGNIPVGTGTAPPPPPPPVLAVPDPTGFTAVSAGVDPADATKGFVDMMVTAPVAVPFYTPHATPIQFYVSPDNFTWTGLGWQSATTKRYAVAPVAAGAIDPDEIGYPQTRYYTVAYRDNSGTPLIGDKFVPSAHITVSTVAPLTVVDNLTLVRTGAQVVASWDVPPVAEGVTLYEVWVIDAATAIDYDLPPQWTGTGTVAGGRVSAPALTAAQPARCGVIAARLL